MKRRGSDFTNLCHAIELAATYTSGYIRGAFDRPLLLTPRQEAWRRRVPPMPGLSDAPAPKRRPGRPRKATPV